MHITNRVIEASLAPVRDVLDQHWDGSVGMDATVVATFARGTRAGGCGDPNVPPALITGMELGKPGHSPGANGVAVLTDIIGRGHPDHLRTAAMVAVGGGDLLAFQGLVADVLAVQLRGDRQHREQHRARPVRVVDPGQRPGEQLQPDPGGLQLT